MDQNLIEQVNFKYDMVMTTDPYSLLLQADEVRLEDDLVQVLLSYGGPTIYLDLTEGQDCIRGYYGADMYEIAIPEFYCQWARELVYELYGN